MQNFLNMKQIADLAYVFHATEKRWPPFLLKIDQRIFGRVCEPTEHEVRADNGARAALAVLAMDSDNVFLVGFEKIKYDLTSFKNQIQGWRMLIVPAFELYELILTK